VPKQGRRGRWAKLCDGTGRRGPSPSTAGQSLSGRALEGGGGAGAGDELGFFVSPRIDSSRSLDALRNSRTPLPIALPISGSLPGPKTIRPTTSRMMSSGQPIGPISRRFLVDALERG